MTLKFTKMHGLGNDFVMLNAVDQQFDLSAEQVRRIADRHFGVGCDQLLIVEPATDENIDFNYRILNHDGSEVGQCGNGARCLARFVHEQGLTEKKQLNVKTITTSLRLQVDRLDWIKVDMGEPEFSPAAIPFSAAKPQAEYSIAVGDEIVSASVLALGNPHCVQFVEQIDQAPVNTQGALIESHALFPERVNACFAQVVSRNHIKARVYERGVGETKACGSGACAIMVAARMKDLVDAQVTIELLGGELGVSWQGVGDTVELAGPAVKVFESELDWKDL